MKVRFLLWMSMLGSSLGVVTWTVFALDLAAWTGRPASLKTNADLVLLLGDNPHEIKFDPMPVAVSFDTSDREKYAGWLATPVAGMPEPNARSRKLHVARLLAQTGVTPDWLVRNEQPYVTEVKLSKADFWHTWRGLEMAESADGMPTEHRDQTLSSLAELGVPLSADVDSVDGVFHVYDLLRTSLNEFHLNQEEISWTATAYACYLPPQVTWSNRYGEQFSFDRLAEEVMLRSLDRESCRGIHLVMALTKLAKVDKEFSILDPQVRERLINYLRERITEAIKSQLEDGSWPLCWSPQDFTAIEVQLTPEENDANRIMVTGHLLEWFHLLPKDLKPPVRSVKAGTLWIQATLRSTSREAFGNGFCPYTHAVVSLDLAACSPTQ